MSNLHLQLEPGEVVLDGEAESWRIVALLNDRLSFHREEWTGPNRNYPDGTWFVSGRTLALRAEVLPQPRRCW